MSSLKWWSGGALDFGQHHSGAFALVLAEVLGRRSGRRSVDVGQHHDARCVFARTLRPAPAPLSRGKAGPATRERAGRAGQMASTFGMISFFSRFMSSIVFDTGTSAKGGHRSGIVMPASL